MKSGTYKFRYNLLGYAKGEDGQPVIIEEEAVHVRKVFDLYLEGCSIRQCREYLIGNHVVSKYGNLTWSPAVIQNMLTNERYCGDMLLQKSFSTDCISKKRKKNRGEMPKYLITDNHPAIISREKFRQVQMEMARDRENRKFPLRQSRKMESTAQNTLYPRYYIAESAAVRIAVGRGRTERAILTVFGFV